MAQLILCSKVLDSEFAHNVKTDGINRMIIDMESALEINLKLELIILETLPNLRSVTKLYV